LVINTNYTEMDGQHNMKSCIIPSTPLWRTHSCEIHSSRPDTFVSKLRVCYTPWTGKYWPTLPSCSVPSGPGCVDYHEHHIVCLISSLG